jgi:hypothetical protein
MSEPKDLQKQEQAGADLNARLGERRGRLVVIDETENNKADDEPAEGADAPAA